MLIIFANYSKSTIILHRLNIEKNKDYIVNAIITSAYLMYRTQ